jgi:hypothetical protein
MFDVFYYGQKPNLFAHEQSANSIEHARQLSKTRYFWWINYLTDYTNFDFLWEPVPWENNQVHIWPSQHQANGGTCLVPRSGVVDFNRQHPILPRSKSVPVVGIDHGNGLPIACDYQTRYISDYLGTLRRILSKVPDEHVWVISSVCDYSQFDFTWHPSEWQDHMLHVFASDDQPFGDTFYVHVPSFLEKTTNLDLLEWYETIHFVEDIMVPRWTMPVIHFIDDSLVPAVMSANFQSPLAVFTRQKFDLEKLPTVSLWREKTKTIVPLNADASTTIVPKNAISHISTQMYDYPYIDKSHALDHASQQQDIVFISYDEPDADKNWKILSDRFARAQRVHGVQGMEKALEAAADVSTTPWYYAVFAKTKLHESFDFAFVPDYMQQPKHYIFNCLNTVNGLEYGHMGVVMYNCKGVKYQNQQGNFGLDYTLSFPHESVPVLSCYGSFDQSPYHTWRTAFRETAKLAYFESVNSTVDGAYRLQVWQTRAQGEHAIWSLRGAKDGVEFFATTQGQLDALKQSFHWEWLREYFIKKYGNLD